MPNAIWPLTWPSGATDGVPAEQVALAEEFAAAAMRALTLNRVGGVPVTVMPYQHCARPRFGSMRNLYWHEAYLGCLCDFGCTCPGERGVVLDGPVGRIDEVRLNGTALADTEYALEEGNRLVRTDGKPWPGCAGPAFTVTYLNAYEVSAAGSYAAGVLAREYLKAITGAKNCRLPSNVTSVSRQGMSFEMSTGLFPEGVTGITEVDTYLMQWNPHGLRTAPRVYSPDLRRPKTRRFGW
jgi:hypothetical protein